MGGQGKDRHGFSEQGWGLTKGTPGPTSPCPPPVARLSPGMLQSLVPRFRLKGWLSWCLDELMELGHYNCRTLVPAHNPPLSSPGDTSFIFQAHPGLRQAIWPQAQAGEGICACPVAQCLTLRLYELRPARLLCLWDFPGKNPGVGCHFLLQGIFPTQGSNPRLL